MFTKEVENMSVVELVKYITNTYHEPLRENLNELIWLVKIISEKYAPKYQDIVYLGELFSQFKTEILKHITREDFITFPAIIKYEKIYGDPLINLSDNLEIMEKLVNDVQMKNEHWEFDSYLNSIINLLEESDMNDKLIKEFDKAKELFIKIHSDMIEHSRLENHDLYFKWKELQQKLKEKLDNFSY